MLDTLNSQDDQSKSLQDEIIDKDAQIDILKRKVQELKRQNRQQQQIFGESNESTSKRLTNMELKELFLDCIEAVKKEAIQTDGLRLLNKKDKISII